MAAISRADKRAFTPTGQAPMMPQPNNAAIMAAQFSPTISTRWPGFTPAAVSQRAASSARCHSCA